MNNFFFQTVYFLYFSILPFKIELFLFGKFDIPFNPTEKQRHTAWARITVIHSFKSETIEI